MRFFRTWKLVLFLMTMAAILAALLQRSVSTEAPSYAESRVLSRLTFADEAHIMTPEQAQKTEEYHKALLRSYDVDYRVVTLESRTQSLESAAREEFAKRKVGGLSRKGRGLLLLIDPAKNEVRLEVSAALEGIFTDAFVSYIQNRQMIPFFRVGRVADGILATTEMMFTRMKEASIGKPFSPPMEGFSTGAGVSNPAQIGAGADNSFRQADPNIRPGGHGAEGLSPDQVVAAYLVAMHDRNGNPDLAIYSEETKKMQRNWVVTAAQMDNVVKAYRACHAEPARVKGAYAVVRYNVLERECAPYFLIREKGEWRLDLTMMQKILRFSHNNQWHFVPGYQQRQGVYGFAFYDWRLDKNGFPHEMGR